MDSNRRQLLALYNEILTTNSKKDNVSKVRNLLEEFNKGFLLANKKEFDKAESILDKAKNIVLSQLKQNSFEYYFSQYFYVSSKSYLEFKMKRKAQSILLTNKGIEYAILLQKYQSSHNAMGLFVSQMLLNLAKIHLLCNETWEWQKLVLENINFLLNFSRPTKCKDLDMSRVRKTPAELRYGMLIHVINEELINITKFKPTNGYEFISLINIKSIPDYTISLIDRWIKLNICISNRQTNTNEFKIEYNNFLEAKHHKYDLRNFKTFLKIRMKELRERSLQFVQKY